jgi:hypothetical protein
MISSLDDGWICCQQRFCIVVAVIVVAACSACVFWHHDGLKLGSFIQSVLLLVWVHYYGIQYEFLYYKLSSLVACAFWYGLGQHDLLVL